MSLARRYWVLAVSVVLGASLLSPPLWWLFRYLAGASAALGFLSEYTVDRIMSRLIALGVVGAFLWKPARFGLQSPYRLGFRFEPGWRRQFGFGLGISLGLALAVTILLYPLGARRWTFVTDFDPGRFAVRIPKALAGAAIIGLVEEYFFRGVLLQGLAGRVSAFWAVVASSAVYALVHFAQLPQYVPVAGYDPLEGFRVIGLLLGSLGSNLVIVESAFLGLFLSGVLLCLTFYHTGRLFVAVGLHGGWVFFTKLDGFFIDCNYRGAPWLYGTGDMLDGVLPQMVVLLAGGAFLCWAHCRSRCLKLASGESCDDDFTR